MALDARPTRRFWAALAHCTATAIGVRLLSGVRSAAALHEAETIWIKATDLKSRIDQALALPVEDQVFRSFQLDEDPIGRHADTTHTRILSAGSSSISLKAAAAVVPIDS